MTARRFTFTSFSEEITIDTKDVQYYIYGREVCPETKRKHLQGYIELTKSCRFKGLKKILGDDKAHIEKARGTDAQNIIYCHKEQDFTEWGKPGKQGARKDLDHVKEMITEGKAEIEIAEEHFGSWVRYHKSFERFRTLLVKPRDTMTKCIVYWGDTGCGKSYKASEYQGSKYYLHLPEKGTIWWDGYKNEDVVILDDFAGEIPFRYLLRILDRYPLKVQAKGTMCEFTSPTVIITADKHPDEWYNITTSEWSQLERRLTLVEEIKRDEVTG